MAMTLLLSSCDGWLGVKPYDKISQDDLREMIRLLYEEKSTDTQ